MIHLTAPILTWSTTPEVTGRIDVDIIAIDLPSNDPRQKAEFGKHCILKLAIEHRLCFSNKKIFFVVY